MNAADPRVGPAKTAPPTVEAGLRTLVADGEALLKATSAASGAGLHEARMRFAERLEVARRAAEAVRKSVCEGTGRGIVAAEASVRAHPWRSLGVAVAIGALAGFLARRR